MGNTNPEDKEFQTLCDLIISRALDSYVKSEYGNLWESHQCRPHAYGHVWSPGFELPAGLLHGHAIAIGMGFGAYLSHKLGWIPESEFRRHLERADANDRKARRKSRRSPAKWPAWKMR